MSTKPPISAVVVERGWAYCSGVIGIDPETGELGRDIQAQTIQALYNLRRVLEEVGFSLTDVVSVTVHITSPGLYDDMNGAYRQAFEAAFDGEPKFPARTAVGALWLPGGTADMPTLVEITATAVKRV